MSSSQHVDTHAARAFAAFADPDGNGWLPVAELLRETETRHGGYEPTAPKHHCSTWYAAYIFARTHGRNPDDAARDAALHVEKTS